MSRRRDRGIKLSPAKELRRNQTRAERLAWRILRNRGCLGLKFRRQHVIRGFVVDFYCPERSLVLEIDGSVHHFPKRSEYDRHRTAVPESFGFRVICVRNQDVSAELLKKLLRPFVVPPLHDHGEGDRG